MSITVAAVIPHTVLAGLVPATRDDGGQAREFAVSVRNVVGGRDEPGQDSGDRVAANRDFLLALL